MSLNVLLLAGLLAVATAASVRAAEALRLELPAREGPGQGRRIVLIAGDEEYRSEETMPMLGKILSQRHGFSCTVLFSIDPATGLINPNEQTNIPGLEALGQADLLVIGTRFRRLPRRLMAAARH